MISFQAGSPDEFFFDRRDWFRVDVMLNKHGAWAVALVLDEGYATREDAEESGTHFAKRVLAALFDVFMRDPNADRDRVERWFGSGQIVAQALGFAHLPKER